MPVSWEAATSLDIPVADLEAAPGAAGDWAPLASAAAKPKSYEGWSRDLAAWLYGQRRLELLPRPRVGRGLASERERA